MSCVLPVTKGRSQRKLAGSSVAFRTGADLKSSAPVRLFGRISVQSWNQTHARWLTEMLTVRQRSHEAQRLRQPAAAFLQVSGELLFLMPPPNLSQP